MRFPILAASVLVLAGGTAGCGHGAQSAADADAWTRGVAFAPMAGSVNAQAAYLVGSGSAAGPYTIRVHVGAGGSIPPHTHPDARILTVVSGEVRYGFGDAVDVGAAKLYRTGDVFVVPAGAPHWSVTGDRDAVYQESGVGPTAFTPVK